MVQSRQTPTSPGVTAPFVADTKRPRPTPATGWSITGAALQFATRAALAQGAAFVIQGGVRMAMQEAYHASHSSGDTSGDLYADFAFLGLATFGTFLFDQTCIHKAVSSVYEWVATKLNGGDVPAQPLGTVSRHLVSLLPTALSVAVVVRESYGDNSDQPMLLAYDLAGMMLGWRLGRLTRDTIQQGTNGWMPKLKIVDMKTGQELVGQQKKTFDDTRLGWQMTMYTATIFINAYVTVPEGLRGILGEASNERSLDRITRLCAMTAPAIGSMLVEAADEVYSIVSQRVVAPRQGAVLEISHDAKTPADWGQLAVRHGAMRALMGTFVTDLAQLVASADRDMDQWSAFGTAIGSVAASIMDIRAKSVGVTTKFRKAAREFDTIVKNLVRCAEEIRQLDGHPAFTTKQRKQMKSEIRNVAHAFSEAGWGAMTPDRVARMSPRELGVVGRAIETKEPFGSFAEKHAFFLECNETEQLLLRERKWTPLQSIGERKESMPQVKEDKYPVPSDEENQTPSPVKAEFMSPGGAVGPEVGSEVGDKEVVHVHPTPTKRPQDTKVPGTTSMPTGPVSKESIGMERTAAAQPRPRVLSTVRDPISELQFTTRMLMPSQKVNLAFADGLVLTGEITAIDVSHMNVRLPADSEITGLEVLGPVQDGSVTIRLALP